jgi:hypothetical protein
MCIKNVLESEMIKISGRSLVVYLLDNLIVVWPLTIFLEDSIKWRGKQHGYHKSTMIWPERWNFFTQTLNIAGKCTPCAVSTWHWRKKLHHSYLAWGLLFADKVKTPPPLTRRELPIITGITWNLSFLINYNFSYFSTTIFDIKCRLRIKLAPALVTLEAWFWYMLFLDLLSANVSRIFDRINRTNSTNN